MGGGHSQSYGMGRVWGALTQLREGKDIQESLIELNEGYSGGAHRVKLWRGKEFWNIYFWNNHRAVVV